MAFDPTKNYAEFGNAFFRGRLKGAYGEARFKLTAGSVNAVDTINIADKAVTYDWITTFGPAQGGDGAVLYETVIDVPDVGVWIEFLIYSDTISQTLIGTFTPMPHVRTIWIDGVLQPHFSGRDAGFKACPYNIVLPMSQGQHTIQVRARYNPNNSLDSSYSKEGYIFCRYIRATGSASYAAT